MPTTPSSPTPMSPTLLRRVRRPTNVRLNPRILGATAVDGALVADGVGVAMGSTGPAVWDVAAAAVLVEAAGGGSVCLDREAFPIEPGRDYADLKVPSMMGPSHGFLEELLHRLTPDGGSLLPR